MSVLIISTPEDVHALAVCWGVRKLGVDCEILYFSDVPQLLSMTLRGFELGAEKLQFVGAGLNICLEKFDTIWCRRVARPVVPKDIHVDDQKQAANDWASVSDSIARILELGGKRVINTNWRAAQLKPWQLACAARAGLSVPQTAITNDHLEAAGFVDGLNDDGEEAIFKSITHAIWQEPGKARILFTTKLSSEEINKDNIRNSPIIIQKFFDKVCDIRVVSFGTEHVGVRIDSQGNSDSKVDFRLNRTYEALDHSSIEIPSAIAEGLTRLNKSLQIEISASDFVLASNGTWHFLETNPTGGFLWMEDNNESITLLDRCCRFLAFGSSSFESTNLVSYAQFSRDFSRVDWQNHLLNHIAGETYIYPARSTSDS